VAEHYFIKAAEVDTQYPRIMQKRVALPGVKKVSPL